MIRDVDALVGHRYDLLVIGGGVHGLFAAYDAAQRGLSVAVIDRGDIGSGLSFNHQRTIHGGLRALERANLARARQQIAERRTWARIAPHLLRPLPFLIGTYRFTRRSRWAVKAGFYAYDVVGRGRNHGVSPELHLPKAKLESAAATKRLFPGIRTQGLSGGAVWYDYQARHPARLTWTVALAAHEAGARVANYVEAIAPLREGGRLAGARVRDRVSGQEHDLLATVTLLAPGSSLKNLQATWGADGAPPLLRAMNLLLDRPARDIAVVAPSPSGRMLTAVPSYGYILAGTHQSDQAVDPTEQGPPPGAIDACLADVNATFSTLQGTAGDIRLVHYGLVPAVVRNGRATLLGEAQTIRHANRGVPGLISLVGTKYTTARVAAQHAVDAVAHELGRHRARSRTAEVPLPHADIADVEGRLIETMRALDVEIDRDIVEHLVGWYGTEAPDVLQFAASRRWLGRVSEGSPVLAAELAYAAEHAMAVHLEDAVYRRTPLGAPGRPTDVLLTSAAASMAQARGWTDADKNREISELVNSVN
jgi:glycerol-3-phosphate dehydrogenase